MQELRFVAVSEDGSYAVLAVPGRSARFVLPIDERLRAVALGQTSRLAQYEIEVESPLRPKEIQARIRAGETVEAIADAAGIAVERVRWFEGPVLAERAYMAEQAQAASVRRQGDAAPGPRLSEIVTERLASLGTDAEDAQWDSRKRGDGSWQVQLTYPAGGRLHVAEWIFDARRRHVMPADDAAARLSLPESELPPAASAPGAATVTQLTPRLGVAAGAGGGRFRPERVPLPPTGSTPTHASPHPAMPTPPPMPAHAPAAPAAGYPRGTEPARPAATEETGAGHGVSAADPGLAPLRQDDESPAAASAPSATPPAAESPAVAAQAAGPAASPPRPADPPAPAAAQAGSTAASPAAQDSAPAAAPAGPPPVASAPAASPASAQPAPATSSPAQPARATSSPAQPAPAPPVPAKPAAAASAEAKPPAETGVAETAAPADAPARPRSAKKGQRGRRSSVPSWDEIMLGSSRQRD